MQQRNRAVSRKRIRVFALGAALLFGVVSSVAAIVLDDMDISDTTAGLRSSLTGGDLSQIRLGHEHDIRLEFVSSHTRRICMSVHVNGDNASAEVPGRFFPLLARAAVGQFLSDRAHLFAECDKIDVTVLAPVRGRAQAFSATLDGVRTADAKPLAVVDL